MITALIRTEGGIEPLAATLAALVPGVAEGLVADAVVIARADEAEIAAIADGVGAAHVAAPERGDVWSAGAAAARRDWLLCLEAGDVPGEGWIGAVERFVAFAGAPRVGRLSRRPASAFVSQFFGAFAGVRGPRSGDIIHRTLLGGRGWRGLPAARIGATIRRMPYA